MAGGLRAMVPVTFAYLGIGFAAGALGAKVGMSPVEVGLLSLLMFAGSAQFIFAELISVAPVTLMVTVFLVNFRHLLYSSSFALKLKQLPIGQRALIGAQLTDESYAVASSYISKPLTSAKGMITLNMFSYSCWFIGTVSGALAGGIAGDNLKYIGIDFALASMFAALLMLQINAAKIKKPIIVVAGVATVVMVILELIHSHPFNLIVASCVAAYFGVRKFGMPVLKTQIPDLVKHE